VRREYVRRRDWPGASVGFTSFSVEASFTDEGLALFAGLNVVPKRSFLTEYSCRVAPQAHEKLMRLWFNAIRQIGLPRDSFDLDSTRFPSTARRP